MRVAPPSGHARSAEPRGLRLLRPCSLLAQNNFNGPVTFELPPVDKNLNVWYVVCGRAVSHRLLRADNPYVDLIWPVYGIEYLGRLAQRLK